MTTRPESDAATAATDSNTASAEATQTAKIPGLLKTAGLIAAVTMVAKLLGFSRDWVIFNVYGASMATDAYFAATQIPSFAMVLLGGLGGPFHTATVAIFSKMVGTQTDAPPSLAVRQLAATLTTLTGLLFAGFAVAVFVWAHPIMAVLLPKASPALVAQSAVLLQWLTPTIFVGGLIGIFYGLLNVYHVFLWPSLSPAIVSTAMIAGLLLVPDTGQTGVILAASAAVGAMGQFLIQMPGVLRRGFTFRPAWQVQLPEFRQWGEVLLPMIIGTSTGQMMVYVDMLFASGLQEGGWSAVILSNRLLQLPIGVLQTALLVPIFPRFSRYVAERNMDALAMDFRKGIVALWLISIPILVVLLVYAEPLIRLVFEHGRFDAGDTRLVTLALVFQAFQMIPYFARDTLTRVFYAFGDSVTPLWVGLLAIGLKFGLNALLVTHYGIGGITLATSIITTINMLLLGWLVRRHIQTLALRTLILPFGKLLLAGIAMAGVLLATEAFLPASWPLVASMAVGIVLGGVVYAVGVWLSRVPEVETLTAAVTRLLPFKR